MKKLWLVLPKADPEILVTPSLPSLGLTGGHSAESVCRHRQKAAQEGTCPLLDFGGFRKMLQLGRHVQDVWEVLLQDHDQVMQQRDIPVQDNGVSGKGPRQ